MIELLKSIDLENVVALLCLTLISGMAIFASGALPPVVNTVVGGIVGYLTRSFKEARA